MARVFAVKVETLLRSGAIAVIFKCGWYLVTVQNVYALQWRGQGWSRLPIPADDWESRKNCDKQLTHIVHVGFSVLDHISQFQ